MGGGKIRERCNAPTGNAQWGNPTNVTNRAWVGTNRARLGRIGQIQGRIRHGLGRDPPREARTPTAAWVGRGRGRKSTRPGTNGVVELTLPRVSRSIFTASDRHRTPGRDKPASPPDSERLRANARKRPLRKGKPCGQSLRTCHWPGYPPLTGLSFILRTSFP